MGGPVLCPVSSGPWQLLVWASPRLAAACVSPVVWAVLGSCAEPAAAVQGEELAGKGVGASLLAAPAPALARGVHRGLCLPLARFHCGVCAAIAGWLQSALGVNQRPHTVCC